MNNFDLRSFLTENKLTTISKRISENVNLQKFGEEISDFLKTQGLNPKMFRGEEPFTRQGLYDKIGKSKDLAGISLLSGNYILIVVPGDRKTVLTALPNALNIAKDFKSAEEGEYYTQGISIKGNALTDVLIPKQSMKPKQ